MGARFRLCRADLRLREHLRWLPGHPAHARDVQEESEMTAMGISNRRSSCPAIGSRLRRARRQAPAGNDVRPDFFMDHRYFGFLDHPLSRMMTAEGARR